MWPEVRHASRGWLSLAAEVPRRLGTNFGDELSPMVVELVTGRRVTWAPPQRAALAAVGSIVELLIAGGFQGVVWGSGCRRSSQQDRDGISFAAVRGQLSATALGLSGTPVGDPGVLASEFATTSGTHVRGRRSAIPHFRTWNSVAGREAVRALRASGFRIIPPTLPPRDVIREVAASELVLSSSLHGLIVAHSLGRPAIRFNIDGHGEPDFKYQDFYSALDEPAPAASSVRDLVGGLDRAAVDDAYDMTAVRADRCADRAGDLTRALGDQL
ncbi:polysaccharide pyruvyl transferase family protein [Nocardioides daeguensis]|uniref:polysaccharide pyruvyl transferase family protein n=2 Tax=Nocardioides daeguensis TaxID=908359 RepID=UPI0035576750